MKFLNKAKINNFFQKNFSFDSGVDLNDEVEVLYRRNKVIKNIIFVSNIIYSVILFLITIGNGGSLNWLWSVIPLPLTFVLNVTIKKIIENSDHQLIRQQIGMYICSIYMIVSSFLVYFKMKTTASTTDFSDPAYMLIYYSMVVISFYQDTRMLKNVFWWMMAVMTVMHFTLTHNFFSIESQGIVDFFKNVLPNNPYISVWFRDIIFRTLVMLLFMAALYINTKVAQNVSDERRTELSKRRDIQDEYTDVVTDLYNVLLETTVGFDDNNSQLPLIKDMALYLAKLCGYNEEQIKRLQEYVLFNQNHELKLDLKDCKTNEEKFIQLQVQTQHGKIVARRMQLSQNAENIVRAHLEGWASQEFKVKMLNIHQDLDSQIILLTEMYVALRSAKSYKRPYPHHVVMDYFSQEYKIYFEDELYLRFTTFHKEIEKLYNDYEL